MISTAKFFAMLKFRLPGIQDNRAPAADSLPQDLRAEACHDLARRSIVGVYAYFLLWLIIHYISEPEQTNDALLDLLGFLLAAVGVWRLYLAFSFKEHYATHPIRWRWLFAIGTILSAAVWGGVSALALKYGGLGTTSIMVMLSTAGIAAGGIVSLAPATWLGGIFIIFLLFPIVPFALLSGNATEKGVALLFLTFFIFMLFLWWRLHTEYWRALAGRAELRQAKEAAEAANQAKGEFIANVSHELRTPLTAIIGALGIVKGELPDKTPPQAMKLVDMAFQNGIHLSALINDLLDFEKLNTGHMSFDRQPLALAASVERALALNHPYAERYHVSFVLERKPPQEMRVVADEQRLLQVMANLLSNAAKHSPSGGKVSVSIVPQDGSVRVTVSDRGTGVPESFRKHVFEKFAQAESTSTRKNHGTGLGLAISKMIVENMGGTIGFESVAGQGATFYFDLPLANDHPTTQ